MEKLDKKWENVDRENNRNEIITKIKYRRKRNIEEKYVDRKHENKM